MQNAGAKQLQDSADVPQVVHVQGRKELLVPAARSANCLVTKAPGVRLLQRLQAADQGV
jgi:hypothetical protein